MIDQTLLQLANSKKSIPVVVLRRCVPPAKPVWEFPNTWELLSNSDNLYRNIELVGISEYLGNYLGVPYLTQNKRETLLLRNRLHALVSWTLAWMFPQIEGGLGKVVKFRNGTANTNVVALGRTNSLCINGKPLKPSHLALIQWNRGIKGQFESLVMSATVFDLRKLATTGFPKA